MDLSFIQEQLDLFSTVGGAIEDIFDAIRELFGYGTFDPETGDVTETEGNLNGLSSYLESSSNADDAGNGVENGETANDEGSSLPGSSEDPVEAGSENGAGEGDDNNNEGES